MRASDHARVWERAGELILNDSKTADSKGFKNAALSLVNHSIAAYHVAAAYREEAERNPE